MSATSGFGTGGAPWRRQAVVGTYLADIRPAIPYLDDQHELMSRLIRHACAHPQRVLDLGAGDGAVTRALLDRLEWAQAVLVDYSAPMLAAARSRMDGRGDGCQILEADLGTPVWLDAIEGQGPFGAVVSGYCIHHLPDDRKRELYGEILSLLAPGGIFLNVEHVASSDQWTGELHEELFREALGDDERRRAYDQREDRQANILARVEIQCGWLSELGFESVDIHFKWLEFALFGGRRPTA